MHGASEYIQIDSLKSAVEIYILPAMKYLNSNI